MAIAEPTILGLKRQTEPTTPTPDPKRPRQDLATKPASDVSPSGLPSSSESVTPTTNTTAPNPISLDTVPLTQQQEVTEKHIRLYSEIKQQVALVQKAQADGASPEVFHAMKVDLGKKIELYKRLSTFLAKLSPSTGTVPAPSSQPPPPRVAVPASTTTPTTDSNASNPVPPAPETAQPPLPSTAAAELQHLTVPNPALPAKESYPTEAAAHPHRLMQQQNQQPLAQQGILS